MWPKMLIELLPHLSRLVPMWDKFLSSKAATEKATEEAMKALAADVRNDLGQVTAAHAGLYRQLQEQSAQIALLQEEVGRVRAAAERAASAAAMPPAYLAENVLWAKRVVASLVAVALLIVASFVVQLVLHRGA